MEYEIHDGHMYLGWIDKLLRMVPPNDSDFFTMEDSKV